MKGKRDRNMVRTEELGEIKRKRGEGKSAIGTEKVGKKGDEINTI
jgi:hypothetical protein